MENIREKIDKRDEVLEARFLLGMKGKRNIVVVGVNPSTATIENLDSTSKRIDNYCIRHNFDGWILINLYPQIDKDVEKLHTEKNDELIKLNLKYIECILKEEEITLKWLDIHHPEGFTYDDKYVILSNGKLINLETFETNDNPKV